MSTDDLQTFPHMTPVAGFAMGAIEFGRARLLSILRELTPEQLTHRPDGFKNDIATLAVHIGATEITFAHRIFGEPVPDDLKTEFLKHLPGSPLPRPVGETVQTLVAKLEKSRTYVERALATLKHEDLSREISVGPERRVTVKWMLSLLPIHLMAHLGHIQMLLQHM